jgi:alkaline phosphatase D
VAQGFAEPGAYLFPFICIWDDHEFSDDCWGDHATYFDGMEGDEASPERHTAANRAWFEYQPADVNYVGDTLSIYRALRYGKHVEFFMTDERSYRGDHIIPPGPTDPSVGKIIANSAVGSRQFVLKKGFDAREAAVKPTMLGGEQKQWLIDKVTASTATWKIWGNEVQLGQMLVDLRGFTQLPAMFQDLWYLTTDQWGGSDPFWRPDLQQPRAA